MPLTLLYIIPYHNLLKLLFLKVALAITWAERILQFQLFVMVIFDQIFAPTNDNFYFNQVHEIARKNVKIFILLVLYEKIGSQNLLNNLYSVFVTRTMYGLCFKSLMRNFIIILDLITISQSYKKSLSCIFKL